MRLGYDSFYCTKVGGEATTTKRWMGEKIAMDGLETIKMHWNRGGFGWKKKKEDFRERLWATRQDQRKFVGNQDNDVIADCVE